MANNATFFYTDTSKKNGITRRVSDMMRQLKKIFKTFLLFFIMFCVLVVGFFCVFGIITAKEKLSQRSLYEMASAIESQSNFVPYEELPETYRAAVIAAEDKRFFQHCGIDVIAIGRALLHDVMAGSYVEGGSTITQQLAKNQYLSQEKLLKRKIIEIFIAFEMERAFSKEEIFALYVNSIYFGSGYYGIAEASKGYYGKEVKDLTDEECITLAGIPNAPSIYDLNQNPDLAEQRKQQIMRQMTNMEDLAFQ